MPETRRAGSRSIASTTNYIPLFGSSGWVRELDASIKPAYKLDDIFDGLRGSYTWDGKLYGLPIYAEVTILYYRKDLYDAAGLKVPATLDELEANAAKLNKPPKTFGIALRGLRGEGMNVYPWTQWLRFLRRQLPERQDGAGIQLQGGGGGHRALLEHLINKYGSPGNGTWGWDKVSSAFASGRVAQIIESTAFYPVFNDAKQSSITGKVGYAVVPAGPKGAYPANYSIGLAVSSSVQAGSKELEAASAFLQWATSQQMEFARTEAGVGNEDRKSVNQSDLLKSKLDAGYIKAVSDGQAITKTHYRPMIPQWREMGDIIGAQIEAAFTGGKSPKEALDAAAKETTDRFKQLGVLGTDREVPGAVPYGVGSAVR